MITAMSNSQKITRIRLSVNEQDLPMFLGIVTPDPDYKLSLKLNKKLTISLKNGDPVEIQDEHGNGFTFSRFADVSEADGRNFLLVSNRSEKNFLLKKLKNIDYLLIIHDASGSLKMEQIMLQVREIDSVTGVFNIELKTLKDKNLRFLV
jgi:hypothetical protein